MMMIFSKKKMKNSVELMFIKIWIPTSLKNFHSRLKMMMLMKKLMPIRHLIHLLMKQNSKIIQMKTKVNHSQFHSRNLKIVMKKQRVMGLLKYLKRLQMKTLKLKKNIDSWHSFLFISPLFKKTISIIYYFKKSNIFK
jgi:hypothetical protein